MTLPWITIFWCWLYMLCRKIGFCYPFWSLLIRLWHCVWHVYVSLFLCQLLCKSVCHYLCLYLLMLFSLPDVESWLGRSYAEEIYRWLNVLLAIKVSLATKYCNNNSLHCVSHHFTVYWPICSWFIKSDAFLFYYNIVCIDEVTEITWTCIEWQFEHSTWQNGQICVNEN